MDTPAPLLAAAPVTGDDNTVDGKRKNHWASTASVVGVARHPVLPPWIDGPVHGASALLRRDIVARCHGYHLRRNDHRDQADGSQDDQHSIHFRYRLMTHSSACPGFMQ